MPTHSGDWLVYYADGTIEQSVWNEKGDVIAVVVYGASFVTQTKGDPLTEHYKTVFYEDEDDAEDLDNPPYFFWRDQQGGFFSGYNPSSRVRTKAGANILKNDYAEVFARMDLDRGA